MLSYATSILLIQLFVAPCIYGLGVLLPLYVYPGSNCAAWSPVSAAISTNPNTQFYIIINPNDGPGSPDANYQACVAALPASTNQVILGFVKASKNSLADIDTYAGWDSSSRPTGIFLDGVSASANGLSTTQDYVSHAKSKGFTFIALDPGQTADSSYFSIADLINTYEDSYSSFTPASLSGTLSKQSVILVNAPSTGSYSAVISELASAGVAAVYISNVPDGSSDLPVQLSEWVSEVAGGSSSGSTSSGSTSSGTTSSSSGSTSSGNESSSNSEGSTSSGSTSENTPSDSPNSNSSASSGSLPKTGLPSASSKSPSTTLSGSSPAKGNIATSAVQSPGSSPSSSGVPIQPETASTSHKAPPIAAIVGGVLGAVVIILGLFVIFLCVRRRRRRPAVAPSITLEAGETPSLALPFTDSPPLLPPLPDSEARWNPADSSRGVSSHGSLTFAPSAFPPSMFPGDVKASLPGPSTEAADTRTSFIPTDWNRLSAAPTYGTAWSQRSSTGAPPAYSN